MALPRPARPARLSTVLLAAALLASACSSGDEPGSESSTASASASASASTPVDVPTASTASTGDAGLRACDLLAPADYARFVPKALRRAVGEDSYLDSQLGSVSSCLVATGPFSFVRFGYSTDTDAWASVKEHTRPEKVEDTGDPLSGTLQLLARKREEVPGIADEAYLVTEGGRDVVWAHDGGVTFRFAWLGNDTTGLTRNDLLGVTVTMLDRAADGVDLDPVQLPEQCPGVDSPEVTAVVGDVVRAFGSAYEGKAPTCSYTGADGRTLGTASGLYPTRALFDAEAIRPGGVIDLEALPAPPGLTAGIKNDEGSWRWYGTARARLEGFQVSTGHVDWVPRSSARVSRDDVLTFVDSYLALAEEQLGVPY